MQVLFEPFNPATGCAKCDLLAELRHSVVYGRGPMDADIMIVGEAPGANEDREGQPFVGRAGAELGRILEEAGLDISEVRIANRLMCRPPDNRDPEPIELENCEPWLVEHIRKVKPKALVLLGRYAIATHFEDASVTGTMGLMWSMVCDACGGDVTNRDDHLSGWKQDNPPGRQAVPLFAEDGQFKFDETLNRCGSSFFTSRRLIASTYHPAYALRNPAARPAIVETFERVRKELE